jgi:transposase-like protein
MPITSSNPFKWRHYPGAVILCCVRWYLSYPLAYAHVAELMRERGLAVDASSSLAMGSGLWPGAGEALPPSSQTDHEELPCR